MRFLLSVLLAVLAATAAADESFCPHLPANCQVPSGASDEKSCLASNVTTIYEADNLASTPSPPADLLDIPISRKAHVPFHNYTSLGVAQLFDPKLKTPKRKVSLHSFRKDMDTAVKFVKAMEEYEELDVIRSDCILKDERFWIWAAMGLCEGSWFEMDGKDNIDPFLQPALSRQFMEQNCCPVCDEDTIEHMESLEDCPHNTSMKDVFEEPGDVTKLFVELINKVKGLGLTPIIHATPINSSLLQDFLVLRDDDPNLDHFKYQPGGPWVVTYEDFVQADEVEALRKWGNWHGFERSGDDGRSVVSWRTSSEAWCTEECLADPIINNLWNRIENVTGTDRVKSDNLQLLQYFKGQFYKTHQDYHKHQAFSQTGARVVTFDMYLNGVDKICNGGGTNFPYLNVTTYPKTGRALVWSNVRDDDVNEESYYARHQALPVRGATDNTKYSATAWFHQREFQTAPEDCRY